MNIGSLEYLVIGLKENQFRSEILPELASLKEKDLIRVVDLLFLSKDAHGGVTVREVKDQIPEALVIYEGFTEDFLELLTDVDIAHLAKNMPPNTMAIVIVLEHTWVFGLTEAVRRAEGTVFSGGMVAPVELIRINAELTEKEKQHA
jgi:hypothetical protein